MKKTLAILLTCLLVLTLFAGCGKKAEEVAEEVEEAAQTAVETAAEKVEEAAQDVEEAAEKVEEAVTAELTEAEPFEYNGRHVEYERCEIGKTDSGEEQLLVYFTYTNNGDKAQSFSMGLDVQVYCNDEQLEEAWPAVYNEATDAYDDEIEIGETVEVANAYEMPESFPVTIKVEPWFGVGDEPLMEAVVQP